MVQFPNRCREIDIGMTSYKQMLGAATRERERESYVGNANYCLLCTLSLILSPLMLTTTHVSRCRMAWHGVGQWTGRRRSRRGQWVGRGRGRLGNARHVIHTHQHQGEEREAIESRYINCAKGKEWMTIINI